ncbi:hypothetical protein AKO1_008262, partial [Acrasis kona]
MPYNSYHYEDSDIIHYSLPSRELEAPVRNKILSLCRQFREDPNLDELTYTFPPLFNDCRQYIHKVCSYFKIKTKSGASIKFDKNECFAGLESSEKTTLKETTVRLNHKSRLVLSKKNISNALQFDGSKKLKKSLHHKQKLNIPSHVEFVAPSARKEEQCKPAQATKETKDDDHCNFIKDSSIGARILNMMKEMGYQDGKGLGKKKQGILNPIPIVQNFSFVKQTPPPIKPNPKMMVLYDDD